MFGPESLCYGNLMDLCLALITATPRGERREERREETIFGASLVINHNNLGPQMHSDSERKTALHQDTI